jgi:transposase
MLARMRRQGSPEALARLRRVGVERLLDGWERQEVAEALGVHVSSVCRWAEAFGRGGWAGLAPAPVRGRPQKLTGRQAERVLSWVRDRTPQDLGFSADSGSHWTARRLASVIRGRLGVAFNHRYLNDWLGRHGISPQLPQRVPRERDEAAIDRWVRHDWPAIKRGRPRRARRSCSPTRRG